MDREQMLAVERVALQTIRLRAATMIGIQEMETRGETFDYGTMFGMQLSAWVLGLENQREVTWSVPATWWDHWKDDHQHRWLVRKLFSPPKRIEYRRGGDVIFPKATLAFQDKLGKPVVLWRHTETLND